MSLPRTIYVAELMSALTHDLQDVVIAFTPELADDNVVNLGTTVIGAKVYYELGADGKLCTEVTPRISFFDKRFLLEDVLLHELAHLLAPCDLSHGAEFAKQFSKLKDLYYNNKNRLT